MNKILLWVFVVGLLLRVGLAVTTYHSDIGAFALAGHYILNQGKALSFYDMTRIENETVFNYQPLAYLYPALVYLPFSSLVSSTYSMVQNNFAGQLREVGVYWPLLIYKLPMLLADVAVFFVMPMFFVKQKQKLLAQILWWFNPLSIYVGSMMGQVDIVIAALLVLSYLNYRNHNLTMAAVLIGLSALFKPIGLIMLPLLFIDSRNLKAAMAGVGTYVLGILPYLSSAGYRYYAMSAEQISKTTYAGIAIASGTVIPWFFVAMVLIAMMLWFKKIQYFEASTAILLSSLAFTHFHPQWLVWITPLFIIFAINKKSLILWATLVGSWILVLLSFDPSLHSQIFLGSRWNLVLPAMANNLVLLARAGLVGLLTLLLMDWWPPDEKLKSH